MKQVKFIVKNMKKYDAIVFENSLKGILEQYPTGKIIMILDNAKIYHAKFH